MKTVENIKKVALVFLLIFGSAHILSGLMISNNYFMPTSLIINRTLDIPFAMTAVIYGLASLYSGLEENRRKTAKLVCIIIVLSVLIGLLYINIFIPDKAPLNV